MTATANASPAVASGRRADRYLTVDGAQLRYRDEGQGPPVVLVHGWTLDLEMWDPQVAALRDAFRLVRLDRRGHGLSGGNPAPQRDGADLAALCRHLALDRVGLIGMSQGARAALALASAAPERVYAVILDGPPDCERPEPEDDVAIERYRMLVRTEGMEAFRREWAHNPLMRLQTHERSAHELLAAMISRYPGNDLKCPVSAAVRAPAMQLDLIAAPVLIINGEHDLPSRLRAAHRLRVRLPAARHAVIAGAGHLPNLDNPGAYIELCRAFLTAHAGLRTSS
jgi:pimeloyl-ACP methyl ester carboxylesterase